MKEEYTSIYFAMIYLFAKYIGLYPFPIIIEINLLILVLKILTSRASTHIDFNSNKFVFDYEKLL